MPQDRNALPEPSPTGESSAYDTGRAAGRAAVVGLLKKAPLETSQVEWLTGFLQGLVEASPGDCAAQQAPHALSIATNDHNGPELTIPPASLAPYTARIAQVESFDASSEGEWLHVTLDVEGGDLTYRPGSTLALWPTNDPEEVRKVLRALNVSAQLTIATDRGPEPAWQVLLEHVNIAETSSLTIDLFAEYSRLDSEAMSLRSLSEMTSNQGKTLLSLLRRFPSARPPLDRLLTSLGQLEPSLVPIASSALEQPNSLSFVAHFGDNINGWGAVGPSLRAKFRPGEWLTVSIDGSHPPRFTVDDLEPAIIIADGPGAAFACAFVAERRARHAKGRIWVLGVGMKSSAFPCARELLAWHKVGNIGRFDVSIGFEPIEVTKTLNIAEETLWRWFVDHSQIYVISTRDAIRSAVAEWFESLIVRRHKVDSATAGQKLAELRAAGLFIEIPLNHPLVPT